LEESVVAYSMVLFRILAGGSEKNDEKPVYRQPPVATGASHLHIASASPWSQRSTHTLLASHVWASFC